MYGRAIYDAHGRDGKPADDGRELGALFEQHDFNAFPVMEDDKMVGIVSKFDFLRVFAFTSNQMVPHYDELMSRQVADVMTEAVVHVDPTSPLTRDLELMVSVKARSFPVLNGARHLEGMISREEIMRALQKLFKLNRNVRRNHTNKAVPGSPPT